MTLGEIEEIEFEGKIHKVNEAWIEDGYVVIETMDDEFFAVPHAGYCEATSEVYDIFWKEMEREEGYIKRSFPHTPKMCE